MHRSSPPPPRRSSRCSPTSCARSAPATVEERRAGVAFAGPLEVAYRACLWSRVASRILLPLATFDAPTPEALYAGVRTIAGGAPRRRGGRSRSTCQLAVAHHALALRGAEDQGRDRRSAARRARRATVVDVERPDVRINVYLHATAPRSASISPARASTGAATAQPAASPAEGEPGGGVLLLADWPRRRATRAAARSDVRLGHAADRGGADRGGRRPGPAARVLRLHSAGAGTTRRCGRGCARGRGARIATAPPAADPRLRRRPARRARRAGELDAPGSRTASTSRSARSPTAGRPAPAAGVLVTNPPYGERLGERRSSARSTPARRRPAPPLPRLDRLRAHRQPRSAKRIGLRPARRHVLYNGAIECRLLELPISPRRCGTEAGPRWRLEPGRREEEEARPPPQRRAGNEAGFPRSPAVVDSGRAAGRAAFGRNMNGTELRHHQSRHRRGDGNPQRDAAADRRKVARARAAQPAGRRPTPAERLAALTRFATAARRSSRGLARTLTSEMGKPITQARARGHRHAARLDFFSTHTAAVLGRRSRARRRASGMRERITYEPLGVSPTSPPGTTRTSSASTYSCRRCSPATPCCTSRPSTPRSPAWRSSSGCTRPACRRT